jgi:hypothetical protein
MIFVRPLERILVDQEDDEAVDPTLTGIALSNGLRVLGGGGGPGSEDPTRLSEVGTEPDFHLPDLY